SVLRRGAQAWSAYPPILSVNADIPTQPPSAVFPGLYPGLFHAGLLDAARQAGARVIGYTPALRMFTDRPARASEIRRSLRCAISIRSIARRERDVSGPAVSHLHIREIGQNRAKPPPQPSRGARQRGVRVPFARRALPPKRRLTERASRPDPRQIR